MPVLPAYFVSHGAPDICLRETPAALFLKSLDVSDARAILVISAHWMTAEPMITAHPNPVTIHDFGGFPQPLYDMQYQSPGDTRLAAEILDMLMPAFPLSALDMERGLDHGAWIPLILAVPEANIPVLQLSIQPHQDARHHYKMGECLRDLREQGVIIMASGNATHNLRGVFGQQYAEVPAEVTRFNDWLHKALVARDDEALMNWEQAPDALWNHPTNDHFLPLFTALGATAGSAGATRIHTSIDYKVLSMDSYRL